MATENSQKCFFTITNPTIVTTSFCPSGNCFNTFVVKTLALDTSYVTDFNIITNQGTSTSITDVVVWNADQNLNSWLFNEAVIDAHIL